MKATRRRLVSINSNYRPTNYCYRYALQKNKYECLDFINCGDSKYVCIEQVSEQSAQKMLQYLNRIQRKDAERPDGVATYDENWKVKNDDTREENFSKRV
jgi:hypothetical protein